MRYSMPVFVLAALLIGAAGCNDSKKAGSNSNGNGSGSGECGAGQILDGNGNCSLTCMVNEDCGDANYQCNLHVGMCVPTPAPRVCDPANCTAGTRCPDAGSASTDCEPIAGWCDDDGDCAFSERCEMADKACVSRAGDLVMTCEQDSDCLCDEGIFCGVGLMCLVGVCIGCLDDIQCGTNGRCLLGACVLVDLGPVGDCIGQTCADGQRCVLTSGLCEVICVDDSECLTDESCLPLLNYCVDAFGCDTEADCTVMGQQCIAGLCIGCQDDADCKASESCVVGACFPRLDAGGNCDGNTCGSTEACDPLDGACYEADGTCTDDLDCRPGHTCLGFVSLCTGCSVDGDCRPNQRCLLSTCVPPL